jgi:glycosyltransferase involved in cell wall biosynthesis
MSKLPISVVIIAKNEETRLPVALASICNWVNEVIVYLNNTTDHSAQIAESFGARVITTDSWLGYRDQKNKALSFATQPWILSLDADEEVSETLKQSIIHFIQSNNPEYNGAYFARKVWFLGRWINHGDWYPDYVVRIWRNGKGSITGPSVHERTTIEGKTLKLLGDLYHYSFPTLESWLKKFPHFSDFFLQQSLEKNKSFCTLTTIFRALWRWFRCYVIRLGFLDGYPGFFIACMQGFATLYRYTRIYEHKQIENKPSHLLKKK